MKVVGIKHKTKGKCTEIRNNQERKDCSDERVLVVTKSYKSKPDHDKPPRFCSDTIPRAW